MALRTDVSRIAPTLAGMALLAALGTGCGPRIARADGTLYAVDVMSSCGPGTSRVAPIITMEVGGAARMDGVNGAYGRSLAWSSSDRGVAEVYQGLIVALRPGATWISASGNGRSAQCLVTVVGSQRPIVSPTAIRQYSDDRKFDADGRTCFGSELNGKRTTTQDERRLVKDNRVINPRPLNGGERLEWEVEDGTEIVDGAGVPMGTVAPTTWARGRRVPSARFNFGMSKIIAGRMYLYAFSVKIRPSAIVQRLAGDRIDAEGTVRTSAWLPLDRIVDKDGLVARVGMGKVKLPQLPLEQIGYRITGGDPQRYMTEYGELRIVGDADAEPVPSHYLRRPSGTVNIIYSVPGFGLGGQGLDSLLVTNGVMFHPARGVRAFVRPTFFPGNHPQRGRASGRTMTFLYGAAVVPGSEPIYGWIAAEALEGR